MKALFPIDITEEGIVICVNDEHPLKALFPIEVTEEGIVICVNAEHPLKAKSPNSVIKEGIDICVNDEHPSKALVPIVVIDDGINISVIGVCGWQHPKFDWDKYKLLLVPKVRGHISDKEEGSSKSIFVNLEHFSNAKGSMDITEDGIVIFSNDEQEEKEYFSKCNKFIIKYIKQFELLETDPEKAAKDFTDKIAIKQSGITKEYFESFIRVIDDVKDISLEKDERQDYLCQKNRNWIALEILL